MNKTYTLSSKDIKKDWLVIDATGQTVGRLASTVAHILRGKHKPTFTPHMDCGDNVIIINAEKVQFSGNKLNDKIYYRHTNHPGGLKQQTAGQLMEKHPERVLEKAIKGMLPKNKLGRQMYRNLYVYVGANHPHEAQQPKTYNVTK